MTIQNKLTKAFRELRGAGYFARKNWQCCQGCGWAAIPEGQRDRAVFYHKQDAENLTHSPQGVYLAWDGDGNEICTILRKHDLVVVWDGSQDKRIWVEDTPGKEKE